MNKILESILPITARAQSGPIGQAADRFEDLTTSDLVQIFLTVASWFLVFVGVIAVIMVLVSAYRFVTSSGEPAAVGRARKTLIWSLVGLGIAILAFSIVTFVASILS